MESSGKRQGLGTSLPSPLHRSPYKVKAVLHQTRSIQVLSASLVPLGLRPATKLRARASLQP